VAGKGASLAWLEDQVGGVEAINSAIHNGRLDGRLGMSVNGGRLISGLADAVNWVALVRLPSVWMGG
jgi:hypothetical protein